MSSFVELIQNTTIEERVTILESQMVEIEKDLTTLDEDVDFLFDDQIIQDERLFSLETETDEIEEEIESIWKIFKFLISLVIVVWSPIISCLQNGYLNYNFWFSFLNTKSSL